MNGLFKGLTVAGALALWGCGGGAPPSAKQENGERAPIVQVGGKDSVTLQHAAPANGQQPVFTRADILPGRGMNIWQIEAYVPGKGVVKLMEAPGLERAATTLNGGPEDGYGNASFKAGGALLVPFANRIRGRMSRNGKTLTAKLGDQTAELETNWQGKNKGAEPHAMHGLILNKAFSVTQAPNAGDQSVTGTLDAGNFGEHWPSTANVTIKTKLDPQYFQVDVTLKNTGNELLPAGIGWHPYLVFPSGDRKQARLMIPASQRTEMNNYDDVFPTGKLIPVKGTDYDFSAKEGKALGSLFLDDCFVDVERGANGRLTAEIIDPAAKYGLRIVSLSPEISAFQAYAPVDKNFVAFEPQYNWGDPFSAVWKGRKTGMVMLKPGESTTYSVRLELFVP